MMYTCGHCGTQFGPYVVPRGYLGSVYHYGEPLCERCHEDFDALVDRLDRERETTLREFARYHLDRLIAESA